MVYPNNRWSIDSATKIFSEEWIFDDEFFVTGSEIYGKIYFIINWKKNFE